MGTEKVYLSIKLKLIKIYEKIIHWCAKTENRISEYVYVPRRCLRPDNACEIGTFKSSFIFESWFKMILEFDV